MATITITPGNTFNPTETVTSTKLNDLGSPTAALVAASVTPSDLSTGAPTWDSNGTLYPSGTGSIVLDNGNVDGAELGLASLGNSTFFLDNYGGVFRVVQNNTERFRIGSDGGLTVTGGISLDNGLVDGTGLFLKSLGNSTFSIDNNAGSFRVIQDNTERMRIDNNGRLLVGTDSSPTFTDNSIFCTGRMGALAAYTLTSAASANMIVTSTGLFERSTSSARYKENVQDYKKGIDAVKSLRPVTYESINEDDSSTYAGFIAEEVHEAGLTEFVDYNTKGQPDALHYANMTALLTKALQEAIARIEVLEAK
tara:strand:+ start:64 stop:993 length:930 start_codon:yes stop_codon:yes gene_type:complete